ncbi:hypothetical protein M9H77_28762 [Catharanthus roseus]|uniref:Uncharacterized protein n=1 Tax=Catharanthus roseus TaxID=4058 RepID=A0ACC0AIG5_CATRO|nr:hypothetical protein M9H77_28762 [Catharanthus roseus]
MNHKGKMKKGKQKKGKPKKGKQSLKEVDKRGILNTCLSSAHFTHSGSSTSSLQRATRPTTVPHKLSSSDSIPVSPTSRFLHLRQPVHRTLIGHLALTATRPMTLPNLPSSSYSVPVSSPALPHQLSSSDSILVLETSRFQDFRCQPIHCTSIGDSTTPATWPATLPNPLSSSYPGPVLSTSCFLDFYQPIYSTSVCLSAPIATLSLPHQWYSSDYIPVSSTSCFLDCYQPVYSTSVCHSAPIAMLPLSLPHQWYSSVPVLSTSCFPDFHQPVYSTSVCHSAPVAMLPLSLPHQWYSSDSIPVEDSISWTMSHPRCFVWNIDGSSVIRHERAGCGGILRDEWMNCIKLFAKSFDEAYSSSFTEVYAFLHAMEITQSMIKEGKLPEQPRVEIRTDFESLAMFIRGENHFSNPMERDLAEKGCDILRSLTTDWNVTKVTRSSNFVADLLAGNAHVLGNISDFNLPEIIAVEIANEMRLDWDVSERTDEYMEQKKRELRTKLGE